MLRWHVVIVWPGLYVMVELGLQPEDFRWELTLRRKKHQMNKSHGLSTRIGLSQFCDCRWPLPTTSPFHTTFQEKTRNHWICYFIIFFSHSSVNVLKRWEKSYTYMYQTHPTPSVNCINLSETNQVDKLIINTIHKLLNNLTNISLSGTYSLWSTICCFQWKFTGISSTRFWNERWGKSVNATIHQCLTD